MRRAWTRVSTLRRSISLQLSDPFFSCLGIPFSGAPIVQSSHCLVPSHPPSAPNHNPHVVFIPSSAPIDVAHNRPHWRVGRVDSSASLEPKPNLLPEWLLFLTRSRTKWSRGTNVVGDASGLKGRGTMPAQRGSQATISFLKGHHQQDARPRYGIEAWLSSGPYGCIDHSPERSVGIAMEEAATEVFQDVEPKKRKEKRER